MTDTYTYLNSPYWQNRYAEAKNAKASREQFAANRKAVKDWLEVTPRVIVYRIIIETVEGSSLFALDAAERWLAEHPDERINDRHSWTIAVVEGTELLAADDADVTLQAAE
jgi:hypothetical protein